MSKRRNAFTQFSEQRLLELLSGEISQVRAFAVNSLLVLIHTSKCFYEDHGLRWASALAYSSLLALVPLLVVIFTMMAAMAGPVKELEQWLFAHLLPSSGEVVVEYLQAISRAARAIGFVSFGVFVLTAISLFNTIIGTFNTIWKVRQSRPWRHKLVAFWCFVTLAPLLITLAILLTRRLRDLTLLETVLRYGFIHQLVIFFVPFVVNWLAFVSAYMLLPYTRVSFGAAFRGGVLAGTLWEFAKIGYDWYVSNVVSYDRIYGSLGAIPVFLLWLFLTWIIILFGAELAFVCQYHLHQRRSSQDEEVSSPILSLRLVLLAAQRFIQGVSPPTAGQLAAALKVNQSQVEIALDKLVQRRLLIKMTNGDTAYLLGQAPSYLLVSTLLQTVPGGPLPLGKNSEDPQEAYLFSLLERIRGHVEEALNGMTVKDLLQDLERQQSRPLEPAGTMETS